MHVSVPPSHFNSDAQHLTHLSMPDCQSVKELKDANLLHALNQFEKTTRPPPLELVSSVPPDGLH